MTRHKGLTPRGVLICGAICLTGFLIAFGIAGSPLPSIVGQTSCSIAYAIALISCWHAAALYPEKSPIRLGWLAIGSTCFLSCSRHVALNPLFERFAGSKDRVFLISQTLQLPALVFLLLGMFAIWWGIYRLGLGFKVRWLDFIGIAGVAAIVPWAFRNSMSHAHSIHGVSTVFQQISLGLLIAIGGVGLLLNGLSIQMGGGRFAVVMRCIVAAALTRSILTLSEGGRDGYLLLWWMAFYSAPWAFAFGAAYSCWLTDSVERGMRNQTYLGWRVSGLADLRKGTIL
jgi:hypothetical protein